MIIYRDLKHATRQDCPPGLSDAVNLTSVEDGKGRLWCAGDPLRLAGAIDREWHALEDGWQVRMTKEGPEPETLRYAHPWAAGVDIQDGDGRFWQAPRILSRDGTRLFRVRYGGPQWLPILTDEQIAVEACANAARQAMASPERAAPLEAVCAWAECFLRVCHPIAPGTLAALGVIDDVLMVESVKIAAGDSV